MGQRKLAKVLRELEELRRGNEELRKEIQDLRQEREILRSAFEKSREKNSKLAERTDELKRKLDTLQNSLAVLGTNGKTAAAVGVPSRRTFFKQPRPPPEEQRKSGGQPGHKGTTRPQPAPNHPPVEFTLQVCPKCRTKLGEPCGWRGHRVTDLPKPHLDIYDVRVAGYDCTGCGTEVWAIIPEGYRGKLGPHVKALIAEYRALGISFDKVVELLDMTYGLRMSEGSIPPMERLVAEALDPLYQEYGEELRDAGRTPAAEGDETPFKVEESFRESKKKEQVWVGTSERTTVYRFQRGRSGDCAASFWEGYEGVIGHDGLQSYNAVKGADHQFDLSHGNRWLQYEEARRGIEVRGFLKERPPKFTRAGRPPKEFLAFAQGMRVRWRKEVLWAEAHPDAKPRARERRYRRAGVSMRRFLSRPWRDPKVVSLAGEYRARLGWIFTFVRVPGVSPYSNGAEREVRVVVDIREKSGGRKTEMGKLVLERLLTVWRTCKKRGLRFWTVVLERLGVPEGSPGPPSSSPTV